MLHLDPDGVKANVSGNLQENRVVKIARCAEQRFAVVLCQRLPKTVHAFDFLSTSRLDIDRALLRVTSQPRTVSRGSTSLWAGKAKLKRQPETNKARWPATLMSFRKPAGNNRHRRLRKGGFGEVVGSLRA
jgi:hypothetical protein